MILRLHDRVRTKDDGEQGFISQVHPDGEVTVETWCNIYRAYSPAEFELIPDGVNYYGPTEVMP